MRSVLNRSAMVSLENRPRRLTHAPRFVETVTSGEVVTTREANSVSERAISCMTKPKPCWVDMADCALNSSFFGTAILAASKRRRPRWTKGTAFRNSRTACSGMFIPSNMSHSCPVRTFIVSRSASTWVGVISPAWLSLWPASGRPKPLIV